MFSKIQNTAALTMHTLGNTLRRRKKPKQMTFTFYLDAYWFTQKNNIKEYEIKKTGLREMTLFFVS